MNNEFLEIIIEIAGKPLETRNRIQGLERINELYGLSFNEALIFWGLTVLGSEQESWGRRAMNNFLVNTGECQLLPIQKEIRQRIGDSGHRDRKLNFAVWYYLIRVFHTERSIPRPLLQILKAKFRVIMS